MQSTVQSFECGESDTALDMADWIKGPRCIFSMAQKNTQVWLFHDEHGSLVGFGSLGTTDWPWPTPQSAPEKVSIIPAIAVQSQFRRQPAGANKEDRYSALIVRFLIKQAMLHGTRLLVLYVHKTNVNAIDLYQHLNFKLTPDSFKGNRKMFLDLSDD